jgi:hypothetical protein
MTKVYNKCYYIVATQNGKSFYQEGSYTEQEISRWINNFDIDEFINHEATDEEYCGPEEGHYAVYRQSMMTIEEALDIGHYIRDGDTITTHRNETPEQIAHYKKRRQELEAEVEAEFGVDNDPLVCLKQFAKVVA